MPQSHEPGSPAIFQYFSTMDQGPGGCTKSLSRAEAAKGIRSQRGSETCLKTGTENSPSCLSHHGDSLAHMSDLWTLFSQIRGTVEWPLSWQCYLPPVLVSKNLTPLRLHPHLVVKLVSLHV